jgi:hypothetical protein
MSVSLLHVKPTRSQLRITRLCGPGEQARFMSTRRGSRRHRQFLARHHDLAPQIRMNAPISLKPFELETKSSIWAIDKAPKKLTKEKEMYRLAETG